MPHGLKTPLATPLASVLALAMRGQVVKCNAHACYDEARARTCAAFCATQRHRTCAACDPPGSDGAARLLRGICQKRNTPINARLHVANCLCKLHSSGSRSRGHRKRGANMCDTSCMQLQFNIDCCAKCNCKVHCTRSRSHAHCKRVALHRGRLLALPTNPSRARRAVIFSAASSADLTRLLNDRSPPINSFWQLPRCQEIRRARCLFSAAVNAALKLALYRRSSPINSF